VANHTFTRKIVAVCRRRRRKTRDPNKLLCANGNGAKRQHNKQEYLLIAFFPGFLLDFGGYGHLRPTAKCC